MAETINFTEGGEAKNVDLMDGEFDDGPPYDDASDRTTYEQLQDDVARRTAWSDWLSQNGRRALAEARVGAALVKNSAVTAAAQYSSVALVENMRVKRAQILAEYGDIPRSEALVTLQVNRNGAVHELNVPRVALELGLDRVVGKGGGRIGHGEYVEFGLEDKKAATIRIYEELPFIQFNTDEFLPARIPPSESLMKTCGMASGLADLLASVAGFLFWGGLAATGLGFGIKRHINRVLGPTDLSVTTFFDVDVQQFVLVVHWEPPAPNTSDPSLDPAVYLVRLIIDGGAELDPVPMATTDWTSPMVEFGKTYKIGVRSQTASGDQSREVVSDPIVIPKAAPAPMTGTPGDPQTVNLVQSLVGNTPTLEVTWAAPASGTPDKYEVTLTDTGDFTDTKIVPGMTMPLKAEFAMGLAANTYTASVTAIIGAAKSMPVPSDPVPFSNAPSGPPESPTGLEKVLSVAADGSPTTVVDLSWKPPATGPGINWYTVARSQGTTVLETYNIMQQSHSFDPVADGTYVYSVTAVNDAGEGPALKETVVVDFSKVDPSVINWDMLIAASDKAAWQAQKLTMNNMDQIAFWAQAVSTVSTGDNGSVASFENQYTLAALYRTLIDFPAEEPTDGQVERMAGILTQQHSPNLTTPDDVWWTQAGTLASNNAAIFSVRWQLAGLMRALEDLLGLEHSIK